MQNTFTSCLPSGDQALLWKSKQLDGISLFKARFNKFAYKKHCHQEYAIGVIENGAQRFHHLGNTYIVPSMTMITVNPNEVHDGMSDCNVGYQYRMVYIKPKKIHEMLTCHSEFKSSPGYFNSPTIVDPKTAEFLHHALVLLDEGQHNHLESHTYLIEAITRLFRRHAGHCLNIHHKDRRIVNLAIDYIHEKVTENITLQEIADAVDLSPYHFLRIFKNSTGLPPHAYLIQMRVELAKRFIEKGSSLTSAAFQSGFSDQSHMTRCFKSVHGLPPGRYKKTLFS